MKQHTAFGKNFQFHQKTKHFLNYDHSFKSSMRLQKVCKLFFLFKCTILKIPLIVCSQFRPITKFCDSDVTWCMSYITSSRSHRTESLRWGKEQRESLPLNSVLRSRLIYPSVRHVHQPLMKAKKPPRIGIVSISLDSQAQEARYITLSSLLS